MDPQVIAQRTAAIRRELRRRRISCLIATKPANVTYVTGFMGDDSWAAITQNRTYLLTDSRYTEQARRECPQCPIIERTGLMEQAVAKIPAKLKSVRKITVEDSISLADFEALQKHLKPRPKSASGIIEAVRTTKDSSEVAAVRASAAITTKALKRVLARIKPGIAEIGLAGLLDLEFRMLGATNSFDTIVAFGPNASRPHHQPTGRRLKPKDTVLIDLGARHKGYCSDITRCFVLGEPTGLYRRVFDVVERAQAAAIEAIAPGVKLTTIDSAARDVIRNTGLPVYGHGTGHGFGLEIHEKPFLKARDTGSASRSTKSPSSSAIPKKSSRPGKSLL